MPALVPVDETLGAAFVGHIASSCVYGVTCLQVYVYYSENCAGDGVLLKVFVAALMVLDTMQLALVSHTLYIYLITNFGDYERLLRVVWSLEVQVGFADAITFLVQVFFAWRIYILSNRQNWWLPLSIIACGLGLLAAATGFIVIGFQDGWFVDAKYDVPWTIGGLTAELAGDTLMTIGTTYYLLASKTGFLSTDSALNVLVTYTLNTGLLTTVFTILTLAIFVSHETTMLYTPFFFILARLYSCAFMSTLNSRQKVRVRLNAHRPEITTTEAYTLSDLGTRSMGTGLKSGTGGMRDEDM